MQPVRLILSFDTEDFETPAADDAERLWAELLARHGLTGCFCVVGEEARALRDRGRRDVVAALAHHEIAYHSDMHSAHPTHAEYLDELDWEAGLRRVLEEESRGIRDVADLFGQWPSAYCKPGSSWGPQVPYGLSLLGVPLFCDAPFELAPGVPLWYARSILLEYHTSFDRYFDAPDRLARMQRDFDALLAARAPGSVVVLYTHPCRTLTRAFTDTFRSGRNPPRSEWGPAPLRPRDEVAALTRDFEAFVGWLADKVEAGELEPTTYRELARQCALRPEPWLDPGSARELASAVAAADRPDYRRSGELWLSPAEQFGVVSGALLRLAGGSGPGDVPVRDLLGPTGASPELAAPVIVSTESLLAAARALAGREAVPAQLSLDGRAVGPAAYLRAAAGLLVATHESGVAPDTWPVSPTPELPALARRDDIAGLRFQGSWSVFPPDFVGRRVLELARLQTWTARPVR